MLLGTLLMAGVCGCACEEPAPVDAGTDGAAPRDGDASDGPSGLGAGSCDHRANAPSYCEDTVADAAFIESFRTACTDGGGTWMDAACMRVASLGGCRTEIFGGDGSQTRWFYEGGPVPDADTLRASCEADSRTYVAP